MGVGDQKEYQQFHEKINYLLDAKIISISRQSDNVIELIVKAPMAARQFKPGQFYRIQNYETSAPIIKGTRLQTEALSALGIVNADHPDQLSFFIVENGASSKLVSTFKAGQSIAVMGPTGAKTVIPADPQSILIVGNQMAIIYLLSVGAALKAAGHTLYFIGCVDAKNRFAIDRINLIADDVTWCDKNTVINALQSIELKKMKNIFVVSSSSLLKTIQHARHHELKNDLNANVKFTASVYGSMQCMLKGVCAQCLQWQIDPVTGKRTKAVYACSWQHQPLEIVDIDNIDDRLGQNRTQEILTNLWLNYLVPGAPSVPFNN
jgi:hypothetical protein